MASHNAASNICQALGRGVTHSKRRAMQWRCQAAENGEALSCYTLAARMYGDEPYAREVGHVWEAAGVATSAGIMEGHDVPLGVLADVSYWLRKGEYRDNLDQVLETFRRRASEGGKYCRNDGCEVVGQLKDFKICPQCKNARYCGAACQKQDWNAGGHKETCGKLPVYVGR